MTTLCTLNLTMGNRVVVVFIHVQGFEPFVVAWNLVHKIDVIKSVFAFWPMVIKPKCLVTYCIIAL
jgi:hypothetical protein